MAKHTIVSALNEALHEEMKRDETVLVLGEDVGTDGGVFRVTEGLLKSFGEERVIDTPLAESAIVGTSIGLAVAGFKPVAEIQFSGFLYPALDQIINHASRIRTRTRGRFHCPLVVRAPYGGGVRALEHHSESMEALYAHIPGVKVVIPSSPSDAKGLLLSAIRDPDPVIFLEPKKLYRAFKQDLPKKEFVVPLGEARVVREGSDLTIISWGAQLHMVHGIVERIKNVDIELIDVRTLKPLDENTILTSVRKTRRCIVVHEGPRTGGYGAEIIARIMEKAYGELEAPVRRVTGFDAVFPLYRLEQEYLPNQQRIVNAIQQVMTY